MTGHQSAAVSLRPRAASELQGIARFRFHEGKLERFKRLSAQCMEIVRAEDTGTLQYEIYFNDDQSECIVLERKPQPSRINDAKASGYRNIR